MSEFKVEVVRLQEITKHPGADKLSITTIHDGYPCIIKTGDFKPGDLAVYIPVDALVPVSRPEFAFLDEGKSKAQYRIKARRLRGIFSMGLLIPAPEGAKEGDDLQVHFGIEKYLPEAEKEPGNPANSMTATKRQIRKEMSEFTFKLNTITTGVLITCWLSCVLVSEDFPHAVFTLLAIATLTGAYLTHLWDVARNRKPPIPVYDIEGLRRYKNAFEEGEEVYISEKIHGANCRHLHTGRHFWIASRETFRTDTQNDWYKVAEKYGLKEKLAKHPNMVLFGEVYGKVQDLQYGVPADERIRYAAFDVMNVKTREYLSVDAFLAFCKELDIPVVPTLYRGPWKADLVSLAEGKTTMPGANHVREGIVIKPVIERKSHMGRVILKLHGEGYLTRK
jgi:tRNA-binding EMAP/Myf-like protein